ncbi:ATP-binding protein [Streptomyces malaysiensis]|uniref:ATP-binding protein n=1 Tax=Streptomyces malaysiensis TaxID=92644 RepID=UPI00202F5EFE|nr:ATP-binding protein [Streptomyces malaysiensis]
MAEQLSMPMPGPTGQAAGTVDLTGARLIGSQAQGPDALSASAAEHDEVPDRPPLPTDDELPDRPSSATPDEILDRFSASEGDAHVLPVPHLCEAVATVRRRAHALLTEWELSTELLDEALMVISELVTNAILHALPPAVLRLGWSQYEGRSSLRIEVTDGGPVPADQRADEDIEPDEHGRGLGIVTALSARHGSRSCHQGITWWADLLVA